ncbi:MAG: N-6 DNA methylase, partial [Gemmatimonadota bacterium]|nr:N-6 DNA methylase [Gemmatimonadota bacterium]
MLDTATKRRIDTARDILVGKVPDPKSQVEQITIALIYKFMDDIDADSEELGGQRTFFAGDFARYGWPQLVRAGLGGHETLNLYAEAITRMPENPGIPPLFRDIFNNAYLPYRDPETLRAFLKVIDEFTYDHSERLGDAFEYLLSVLGSQGDAGQFRTPRHIIDFIVSVIDPKKDEKILDPACGTAGFLISSYKHILKANIDDEGNSTLTPDDKGTLAANVRGYDISPDMVRLSLVNLYLHDFREPHIFEYDTLTSEERWIEYADVILANPPFMSPKGGIRPHRRFSVQSKRSEVLFVDYIAEHLNPTGRAGIIVPEGIIFQSQTAHKQLRKMLVENYLVAVISLPAGVFQPYSGVKTSILLLDKALAQKTDRVAFFKVENDGFDLGAQRREIAENDLPKVREELGEYLGRLRAGESVPSDGVAEPKVDYTTAFGLIAEKEKIAAGGEYNLSGERYRENERSEHSFPLVSLGDSEFFCIESGGTPKSSVEEYWDGGVPWATLVDLPPTELVAEIRTTQRTISEIGLAKSSAKLIPENSVIVSTRATIGRIGINRIPLGTNQGFKNIIIKNPLRAMPEYIALAMTKLVPTMNAWASGGTFKEISKSKFCELQIPLPPPEVQREIVAEIEGYQRVID